VFGKDSSFKFAVSLSLAVFGKGLDISFAVSLSMAMLGKYLGFKFVFSRSIDGNVKDTAMLHNTRVSTCKSFPV